MTYIRRISNSCYSTGGNLGTLAVYKQKCLLPECNKKTETEWNGLFFCCVEHWLEFKELCAEIDGEYQR